MFSACLLDWPAVKISGFTFIRNGIDLGYPFVPSIRSLLPLCDEVIVNVPRSTDGTLDAIRAIDDPKIRIIESHWDDTQRKGGLLLSHHTNIAFDQCTGDWCVYIQGDEALHEATIPAMKTAMERELKNLRVVLPGSARGAAGCEHPLSGGCPGLSHPPKREVAGETLRGTIFPLRLRPSP